MFDLPVPSEFKHVDRSGGEAIPLITGVLIGLLSGLPPSFRVGSSAYPGHAGKRLQ
jgi:hypothetical protein